MSIRPLTLDDIPAMIELVKLDGPALERFKKQAHNYCSNKSSYSQAIGFFDDGLKGFILFHLNDSINAWTVGRLVGSLVAMSNLFLYATNLANESGFYQLFTVMAANKSSRIEKIIKERLNIPYEAAIDEKVRAKERPLTNVYWDWLFMNTVREQDVVITHYWLPQIYRS